LKLALKKTVEVSVYSFQVIFDFRRFPNLYLNILLKEDAKSYALWTVIEIDLLKKIKGSVEEIDGQEITHEFLRRHSKSFLNVEQRFIIDYHAMTLELKVLKLEAVDPRTLAIMGTGESKPNINTDTRGKFIFLHPSV
jgi:hypothetical protein